MQNVASQAELIRQIEVVQEELHRLGQHAAKRRIGRALHCAHKAGRVPAFRETVKAVLAANAAPVVAFSGLRERAAKARQAYLDTRTLERELEARSAALEGHLEKVPSTLRNRVRDALRKAHEQWEGARLVLRDLGKEMCRTANAVLHYEQKLGAARDAALGGLLAFAVESLTALSAEDAERAAVVTAKAEIEAMRERGKVFQNLIAGADEVILPGEESFAEALARYDAMAASEAMAALTALEDILA